MFSEEWTISLDIKTYFGTLKKILGALNLPRVSKLHESNLEYH